MEVSPAHRFGRPTMRFISTDMLAGQWYAGLGEAEILGDYTLTRHELLVALWYEATYGRPRFRKAWKRWADEVAHPALAGSDQRAVDELPMPPAPAT